MVMSRRVGLATFVLGVLFAAAGAVVAAPEPVVAGPEPVVAAPEPAVAPAPVAAAPFAARLLRRNLGAHRRTDALGLGVPERSGGDPL